MMLVSPHGSDGDHGPSAEAKTFCADYNLQFVEASTEDIGERAENKKWFVPRY